MATKWSRIARCCLHAFRTFRGQTSPFSAMGRERDNALFFAISSPRDDPGRLRHVMLTLCTTTDRERNGSDACGRDFISHDLEQFIRVRLVKIEMGADEITATCVPLRSRSLVVQSVRSTCLNRPGSSRGGENRNCEERCIGAHHRT